MTENFRPWAEREVVHASARMQRWARRHPEADTQGLDEDEWTGLARAALNLPEEDE